MAMPAGRAGYRLISTDASPTSSRTPAHGSGATWIATPSSQWTFTTYSLPVSPGALTRVAACTLALSPMRDTLIEGFSHFRYLHDCSDCFRLERSPGGTCTHWKAPPCHGARHKRTFTNYVRKQKDPPRGGLS